MPKLTPFERGRHVPLRPASLPPNTLWVPAVDVRRKTGHLGDLYVSADMHSILKILPRTVESH